VNRKQIRGFAELEFIAKAENIVFIGESGRGKTRLDPLGGSHVHKTVKFVPRPNSPE